MYILKHTKPSHLNLFIVNWLNTNSISHNFIWLIFISEICFVYDFTKHIKKNNIQFDKDEIKKKNDRHSVWIFYVFNDVESIN